MDHYCLFLDILGFRKLPLKGMMQLLSDSQIILESKTFEDRNKSSIPPELQTVYKRVLADSFTHFLSFSDSVLVISDDLDGMIRQVVHFLCNCFTLMSPDYASPYNQGMSKPNPLERQVNTITHSPTKGFHIEKGKEILYPLLFRGGLTFGEVNVFDFNNIVDKKEVLLKNVAGKAYVEAVKLEATKIFRRKSLFRKEIITRGPRLFFNSSVASKASSFDKYINIVDRKTDLYELLWPALSIIESNLAQNPNGEFFDLDYYFLRPAVSLWKFYKNEEFAQHYDEFIALIIRSIRLLEPSDEFKNNVNNELAKEGCRHRI